MSSLLFACQDILLLEFFALALVTHVHLVIGVVAEMKMVLGVFAFTITSKPKKA